MEKLSPASDWSVISSTEIIEATEFFCSDTSTKYFMKAKSDWNKKCKQMV